MAQAAMWCPTPRTRHSWWRRRLRSLPGELARGSRGPARDAEPTPHQGGAGLRRALRSRPMSGSVMRRPPRSAASWKRTTRRSGSPEPLQNMTGAGTAGHRADASGHAPPRGASGPHRRAVAVGRRRDPGPRRRPRRCPRLLPRHPRRRPIDRRRAVPHLPARPHRDWQRGASGFAPRSRPGPAIRHRARAASGAGPRRAGRAAPGPRHEGRTGRLDRADPAGGGR